MKNTDKLSSALSDGKNAVRRNKILAGGVARLKLFLATTIIGSAFLILYLLHHLITKPNTTAGFTWGATYLTELLLFILLESVLFWSGIIRVYTTSVQLGIKWRIIGIACGFIPFVHIWALCRIIAITSREAAFEKEKYLLDQVRSQSRICHTKYPLLLVHGVFFRDFRFFNYWGRIPCALKQNGAVLYYGSQQSAASVASCGQELAARIRTIVQETGCEKVNIIAHSKGGLDSRYAISACSRRNEKLPDHPDVYYQSVGSRMNCASSGRFPLNMAYPLVKHFDGANDGLVSMESARWGENFIELATPDGRGISHGDMIDLNRENIPGFDMREFYVNLAADLKNKGY